MVLIWMWNFKWSCSGTLMATQTNFILLRNDLLIRSRKPMCLIFNLAAKCQEEGVEKEIREEKRGDGAKRKHYRLREVATC